jgi:hypothetical protein
MTISVDNAESVNDINNKSIRHIPSRLDYHNFIPNDIGDVSPRNGIMVKLNSNTKLGHYHTNLAEGTSSSMSPPISTTHNMIKLNKRYK